MNVLTGILVVILALAVCSCNRSTPKETGHGRDHSHGHGDDHAHADEAATDAMTFSPEQAAAVGLQVAKIQPTDFHQVIKATGELMAPTDQEVVISATSSGILTFSNRNLSEGATVSRGASIATISSKNIIDGDPQAKLKVQYQMAERAYRRAKTLLEDQLISQKAYEEALLNYETAKAAYGGLKSASSSAGIRITSPMGGYVKSRLVDEGAFVSVGQPILTVTQNKRLRLKAEVSQKYQQQLSTIRSANFKLPFSDQVYQLDSLGGQLTAYGVAGESGAAFLPISFELDNKGTLPIGSYVDVFLLTNPLEDVLVVPKTALVEEQGMYSVFVESNTSEYIKKAVVLGEDNGDHIRILTGIQPGDRVVTKGALYIKLANASGEIPHGHSH